MIPELDDDSLTKCLPIVPLYIPILLHQRALVSVRQNAHTIHVHHCLPLYQQSLAEIAGSGVTEALPKIHVLERHSKCTKDPEALPPQVEKFADICGNPFPPHSVPMFAPCALKSSLANRVYTFVQGGFCAGYAGPTLDGITHMVPATAPIMSYAAAPLICQSQQLPC